MCIKYVGLTHPYTKLNVIKQLKITTFKLNNYLKNNIT